MNELNETDGDRNTFKTKQTYIVYTHEHR